MKIEKRAKRKRKIGAVQQKIILALAGGLAMGLSPNPRLYYSVLNGIIKEWKNINEKQIKRSIEKLYESKLIERKFNRDGSVTLVLEKLGEKVVFTHKISSMEIMAQKKWDGMWRIITSDIPEKLKRARDSYSKHMKRLGFFHYQKSVFVHPYECTDEVEFSAEYFDVRPYVRIILAHKLDNEEHIMRHFGLHVPPSTYKKL